MWALLTEYNVLKKDKEKRTREFEEDIVASYRVNDDDDDEDQELAYARQHSLMQHEMDYYPERHFMIDTNMSFRAMESPYANPLVEAIHEVGKAVRAPTAYDMAEVYLPEELGPIWDERGVTIMCDGWGGPTNMSIINFLIYYVRGSGEKKLMENYKNLYWIACAAHCLDFLLEDPCNKSSIKKVISRVRLITEFIYTYKWVTNYIKKFTNGRQLTRPAMTRFAPNFIMLESIVKQKSTLQEIFHSTSWLTSRYSQLIVNNGKEVHELLSRNPSQEVAKFWSKVDQVLKIQKPIVKVLRLLFIYSQRKDSFSTTWWVTYGESAPQLRGIAVKVLSQTTSSSNCERNWNMWSLVHTKTRNRLKYKRLHMIVYLRYNMCDRINELIEEEEEEEPFFNGEDTSWLDVDEDDDPIRGSVAQSSGRGVVAPPFSYNSEPTSTTTISTSSSGEDERDGDGDGDGDEYKNGYGNAYEGGEIHGSRTNYPNVD
ncbi:hypothetical protein RND81_05G044300 [Saponaria officinalis]|uniref:HAT C-terminal dimerisation domain-containing protein n=1 Tax=Saponaria officinalis TaxID=3572 RepID=A0AAW1KQA5_SAPOF